MHEYDPDDGALIRAAQAGEEQGFARLLERHAARLHEFLRPFGRTAVGAEDLAQVAWIAVHRNLQRCDPARPFRPWLFAIARRAAIDAWRRRDPAAGELQDGDWVDRQHPGAALQAAGEAASIWDWVGRHVSREARDALWLMYREELPVQEIAEVLRCSTVRVKVMLFRARRRLATAWREDRGPAGLEDWNGRALAPDRSIP